MFLRYFYLLFGSSSYDDSEVKAERRFQRQKVEGGVAVGSGRETHDGWPSKAVASRELVTWDVGVACLALSVKVGTRSGLLLPTYLYLILFSSSVSSRLLEPPPTSVFL